MSSSFSKIADKNFVIGFFIPALLWALSTVQVYGCPQWASSVCRPSGDILKDVTYLAIVVWILAVLLVVLNYSFYRLLEGYSLPSSWSQHLKERRRKHLEEILQREHNLRNDNKTMEASSLRFRRLRDYPSDPSEVLPTRFGNAIKAFEVYPREIYGADSISVWPRLLSVIPKDFCQRIDDAHTQVDLFVNVCILAGVLLAAATLRLAWLAGAPPLASLLPSLNLDLLNQDLELHAMLLAGLAAVASIMIAVLAYWQAVERVDAWGNTVKTAFDCFLPNLAMQMGYMLPASDTQRRAFWTAFSRQALYRRTPLHADQWWTIANAAARTHAPPSRATATVPSQTDESSENDV